MGSKTLIMNMANLKIIKGDGEVGEVNKICMKFKKASGTKCKIWFNKEQNIGTTITATCRYKKTNKA
jgi:hypothetical protein